MLVKGKIVNSQSQKAIIQHSQELCFDSTKNSIMSKFLGQQPQFKELSKKDKDQETIVNRFSESQILTNLTEKERQKKIFAEIDRDNASDIENPHVLLNGDQRVNKTKI